jgi:hypothetical protein
VPAPSTAAWPTHSRRASREANRLPGHHPFKPGAIDFVDLVDRQFRGGVKAGRHAILTATQIR